MTTAHWSAVSLTHTSKDRIQKTDVYWTDWEAAKRSYELMARYVHPCFDRQSNLQRVASYDDAEVKHATAGAESQQAANAEIERYNQGKSELTGTASSRPSWTMSSGSTASAAPGRARRPDVRRHEPAARRYHIFMACAATEVSDDLTTMFWLNRTQPSASASSRSVPASGPLPLVVFTYSNAQH